MDNETRLNIQYEIFKFLSNSYYHLNVDDDDITEMARKDSYKIMKIIEDGLKPSNSRE